MKRVPVLVERDEHRAPLATRPSKMVKPSAASSSVALGVLAVCDRPEGLFRNPARALQEVSAFRVGTAADAGGRPAWVSGSHDA